MISRFQKIFVSLSVISIITFLIPTSIKAASASDFLNGGSQNNVISNENFVDINSMDVNAIQSFLTSHNSFLQSYHDNSSEGAGRSAAQIIYDAAHASYSAAAGTAKGIVIDTNSGTVSPKVILVFLQKEQSLISRTTQNDGALNAAMGYQCPDSGGCDPDYAGFAMQVGWGAWQLRYNYEAAQKPIDWWNSYYGAGSSSICYVGQTKTFYDYTNLDPGYSVTFANAATASVYRYTPHVFDSAFNVWNMFNNTYFSGSTPSETNTSPPLDSYSDDTASWNKATYAGSITITGTKSAASIAYFNNEQIAGVNTITWQINFDAPIGTNDYAVIYKDQSGSEINRKNIQVCRHKTADSNGDGNVDSTDLSILADSWGRSVTAETAGDMNGDGVVDSTDLSILADAWGK